MNENRFLAENPILMQSKVKLRIKKRAYSCNRLLDIFRSRCCLKMSSGTFSNKSLTKKQYFKAVTDFNHGIENRMIYKVKFTREEECNAESCSSKEKYK